jgi:sugar phosphate isomerase/epimerase
MGQSASSAACEPCSSEIQDWYPLLKLKKSIALDSLKLPFRDAIETAARMGAEGIEINARTGLRPQDLSRTGIRQIKKWLDDYRLRVACVQYPTRRGYGDLNELERRLEGTRAAMTLANDLGCRVVSNRLGRMPDDDDTDAWSVLRGALEELGRFSLKSGAWLAMRTGRNGPKALQALFEALPDGSLFVDFDPAELMIYGHDPVATLKAVVTRVVHFRARDAVQDLKGGPAFEVQLGRGTVDFPELLAILEESNYSGFITIDRSGDGNLISDCALGLEYLENLFA